MRVVRANGQNVSPSDDGKLFNRIFTDGLFDAITITSLGASLVHIPAMYGIMMGREFVTESQDFTVKVPSSSSSSTGYIVVRYNLAEENVISIVSYLGSYTPTQEDINASGTVYEMVLATYTATNVAVTNIAMVYSIASNVENTAKYNVSLANWSSTTTTVDGRKYYTQSLSITKVIDNYPIINIGATGTLPTEAEENAYDTLKFAYLNENSKTITLYCLEKPESSYVVLIKGVK